MMQHGLSPEDGRVAEARAMIEAAFVIQPADQPVLPPRASRILEILR
jgi:hypothetical protein